MVVQRIGLALVAIVVASSVAPPLHAQGVPPYDTEMLDQPKPPAAASNGQPSAAQPSAGQPDANAGAPPASPPTAGPATAQVTIPPHADTIAGILGAARDLATGGQTLTAGQLVEEAETRLLDRSVEAGTSDQPIQTPMIQALGSARRALVAGQAAQGVQLLDEAIAHLPPIEPAR